MLPAPVARKSRGYKVQLDLLPGIVFVLNYLASPCRWVHVESEVLVRMRLYMLCKWGTACSPVRVSFGSQCHTHTHTHNSFYDAEPCVVNVLVNTYIEPCVVNVLVNTYTHTHDIVRILGVHARTHVRKERVTSIVSV